MRNGVTEVTIETILISVLNVFVVYIAAFTYKLDWVGVMTVIIIASLLTATVTHFILSTLMEAKVKTEMLVSEGLGSLGVALLSSIAVLVILTRRFNLPEALGISLLSGVLTSLIRSILA